MIGVMESQAVRMCSDVTILIVIIYDEFTMCHFYTELQKIRLQSDAEVPFVLTASI